MKNMMKKLVAMMLVLVTVLTMASVSVYAETEYVEIDCCNSEIFYGDKVTLVATVHGVEGSYQIVWESNASGAWTKVASGSAYSFIATEQSASCEYRAIVIVEG